jgi:hypothetical protein
MTKLHDPELEHFKRTVDLAQYAKSEGYASRPQSLGHGLAFLEHPSGDKIVVGQRRSGEWIYASVPDYEPKAPGESTDQALARLRTSIERSTDKGTIVEFVQNREGKDVSIERVRDELRQFASGREFDLEAAVDASTHPSRDRRPPIGAMPWQPPPSTDEKRSRAVDPPAHIPLSASARAIEPRPPHPLLSSLPRDRVTPPDKNPMAQRRYDWTPLSEADRAMLRRLRDRTDDRGR